jgi:large subunit ribosomal protein L28
MSRRCQVTGKQALVGNKISHSNRKAKRRFEINLRSKRYWLAEENRWIRLRLTAQAMKIIDKRGLSVVVAEMRARGEAV